MRRKKVEVLTKGEYDDIRDRHVRDVLKQWLDDQGGDPKKIKWTSYPSVSVDGPKIRSARILVRQQLSLMAPVSTGYADLGSNHHIAIYRGASGKAEFEVVSLFEASKRLAKKEQVVRRDRPGCSFVMSLAAGDAVAFPGTHPKAGIRIVQGVWAAGRIVLKAERDADGSSVWIPPASTLLDAGAKKLSVDPIGRIHPAND